MNELKVLLGLSSNSATTTTPGGIVGGPRVPNAARRVNAPAAAAAGTARGTMGSLAPPQGPFGNKLVATGGDLDEELGMTGGFRLRRKNRKMKYRMPGRRATRRASRAASASRKNRRANRKSRKNRRASRK